MRQDIAAKREKEKELVSLMIALYCRKKHKSRHGLCACKQPLSAASRAAFPGQSGPY